VNRIIRRPLTVALAAVAATGALGFGIASAATPPVTKVTGLHVTATAQASLTIGWTAPADHNAKVRVQVYDADTLTDTYDTAYRGGDVTGKATVTATGLSAGTAYMLRADEYDGTANSGWTAPVTVYTAATGSTGTQGPAGPAGPSGVVSVASHDLGAVASVATGGSFATGKTLVGTVALKAGTYLLAVNAKATPNVSSAVEVFPQFFVYDGAALADFSNDLFNVGSGPLASLNTSVDSYYSGTGVVTLAAGGSINVYAFGYNSDRSAGTYALDDLTVTAVALQAAS
jgi:hypothetical protein